MARESRRDAGATARRQIRVRVRHPVYWRIFEAFKVILSDT